MFAGAGTVSGNCRQGSQVKAQTVPGSFHMFASQNDVARPKPRPIAAPTTASLMNDTTICRQHNDKLLSSDTHLAPFQQQFPCNIVCRTRRTRSVNQFPALTPAPSTTYSSRSQLSTAQRNGRYASLGRPSVLTSAALRLAPSTSCCSTRKMTSADPSFTRDSPSITLDSFSSAPTCNRWRQGTSCDMTQPERFEP